MKALGIDYGTKRVGIALSDESAAFAFPHAVLPNDNRLVEAVGEIVAREGVDSIVIGHSAHGSRENPVMEEARAFAEALAEKTGILPVFEWEGYTSALARRQFESREKTRAPKKAPAVDASAAALILESYFARTRGA